MSQAIHIYNAFSAGNGEEFYAIEDEVRQKINSMESAISGFQKVQGINNDMIGYAPLNDILSRVSYMRDSINRMSRELAKKK